MKIIYRDGANASTGVAQYCSWQRAREYLETMAGCRQDETVEAIDVTGHGLELFICKKHEVSQNRVEVIQ